MVVRWGGRRCLKYLCDSAGQSSSMTDELLLNRWSASARRRSFFAGVFVMCSSNFGAANSVLLFSSLLCCCWVDKLCSFSFSRGRRSGGALCPPPASASRARATLIIHKVCQIKCRFLFYTPAQQQQQQHNGSNETCLTRARAPNFLPACQPSNLDLFTLSLAFCLFSFFL